MVIKSLNLTRKSIHITMLNFEIKGNINKCRNGTRIILPSSCDLSATSTSLHTSPAHNKITLTLNFNNSHSSRINKSMDNSLPSTPNLAKEKKQDET